MPAQRKQFLARFRVPELYKSLSVACCKFLAIWAENRALDGKARAGHLNKFFASLGIPNSRCMISASRDNSVPVQAVCRFRNIVFMSLKRRKQFAAGKIKDLDNELVL